MFSFISIGSQGKHESSNNITDKNISPIDYPPSYGVIANKQLLGTLHICKHTTKVYTIENAIPYSEKFSRHLNFVKWRRWYQLFAHILWIHSHIKLN